MAAIQNKPKTKLEGTRRMEDGHSDAVSDQYLERRSLVLHFLRYNLSLQQLQHHRNNIEQLKKCYFYLELQPKHVVVRDRSRRLHCTDIFRLVDTSQLLRMKTVAKNQIETQLSLLSALLKHLEQGREELISYALTCDRATFLSQWDLIKQRMSKLSEFKVKLFSLQMPGKLHMKHRLIFQQEADRLGIALPSIKLSLSTKKPLIFDRKGSFAHMNWATVRWFDENQESQPEQYELHIRLLASESPTGTDYRRLQLVTSNICIVQDLQPDRSYEFMVTRSDSLTLVFHKWHDSIILKTNSKAVEDAEGNIYA